MNISKKDETLGSNLKKLRKAAQLTQDQVVTHLQLHGIKTSKHIYSQIENSKYNIRAEEVRILTKLFKATYDDLFLNISSNNTHVKIIKIRTDEIFCSSLKALRQHNKISQYQLHNIFVGHGIQMSRSMYSQIELGKYNIPVYLIVFLKTIFNTDYQSFFISNHIM